MKRSALVSVLRMLAIGLALFLLAACSGAASSASSQSEPAVTSTPSRTPSPVPSATSTATPEPSPTPVAGGGWLAHLPYDCFPNTVDYTYTAAGRLYLVNVSSGEQLLLNDDVAAMHADGFIDQEAEQCFNTLDRLAFAVAPAGDKIAYSSFKGRSWALYLIDLATMEEIQLVEMTGQPDEMIWLAGRDWLVFTIDDALWSYQFSAGLLSKLDQTAQSFEAIPDDPHAFAFHDGLDGLKLKRYDLQTGTIKVLSDALNGFTWDSPNPWHPDGNHYLVQDWDTDQFYLLDLQSQQLTEMFPHYLETPYIMPTNYSYSSDGNRILIEANHTKIYPGFGYGFYDSAIALVDSATQEMTILTGTEDESVRERDPIWSPDGTWIAYMEWTFPLNSDTDNSALYILNPETGEQILMSAGLERVGSPQWFLSSVLQP